ncbi:MAG: CHASE2 domain-containing protein, partial [Desulfopila sp.]|nr:CHASE2 domain-containing protein [Desulfopila sp.]
MKRLGKPLLAGLLLAAAAICFSISTFGMHVEEEYGLSLLFKLRGSRPPPAKVVIINIDDNSGEKPAAPSHFSKWPRTIYAELVDRLVHYGAKVIVFDVLFAEEKKQHEDQEFAEKLRQAGNVILAAELQHKTIDTSAEDAVSVDMEMEQLLPPIKVLADAALALAPFPLPKTPVRVSRTWRFKSSCGEIPILPSTAFQAANLEVYSELRRRLSLLIPDSAAHLPPTAELALSDIGLTETMRRIRCIFLERPGLAEELITMAGKDFSLAANKALDNKLSPLIAMYAGPDRSIIDFYGPPFSITTISYHDVMGSEEEPSHVEAEIFKGKTVFIGAARNSWSQQKDGFYTVFSQTNGLDISGVEIAATIYTNLSENRTIQPLQIGIMCVFIT